jgi:hypothetical protein
MFGLEKLFKRKEPTVEDLARALLPQLAAMRSELTFTFEPSLQIIRGSDGGVISLTNLHVDYLRATHDKREALLRNFVQGLQASSMPATFLEAKERLLPALRNLPGLDQARLLAGDGALEVITRGMRSFSPTLMISVVHDSEHAMQQVSADVMERWGVSAEQLHEVAIDNLRHKAAPALQPLSPGLYVSTYGDFYDAARILLPELAWQLGLPGAPVAMVPNRICLLVASDQDGSALCAMVEKAREVLASEARPLAAEMFRMQDGQWHPWMPTDVGAARALRELQAGMLTSDYAAQKQLLDDKHEKCGVDVFVGTHTLVQRGDGTLVSYSVLSKGVTTWLPRTDVVVFFDPDNPSAGKKVVEWAEFERGLGHYIEVLPFVPPRYFVREEPPEALVASLREGAL